MLNRMSQPYQLNGSISNLNIRSYMSAHVLFNLLNELGKEIKCEACRKLCRTWSKIDLLNVVGTVVLLWCSVQVSNKITVSFERNKGVVVFG